MGATCPTPSEFSPFSLFPLWDELIVCPLPLSLSLSRYICLLALGQGERQMGSQTASSIRKLGNESSASASARSSLDCLHLLLLLALPLAAVCLVPATSAAAATLQQQPKTPLASNPAPLTWEDYYFQSPNFKLALAAVDPTASSTAAAASNSTTSGPALPTGPLPAWIYDKAKVAALETALRTVASLSGASTLVIFACFALVKRFRTTANVLLLYVSFADLIFSKSATKTPPQPPPNSASINGPSAGWTLCTVQGFIVTFGLASIVCWNTVMAMHCLLVVKLRQPAAKLQRLHVYYHLACWSIALMVALIALHLNRIVGGGASFDSILTYCWISTEYVTWRLYLFYIPLWVSVAANVAMYVAVVNTLNRTCAEQSPGANSKTLASTRTFTRRIFVYIGCFAICWIIPTISRIHDAFQPLNPLYTLTFLHIITAASNGFFNALAFFFLALKSKGSGQSSSDGSTLTGTAGPRAPQTQPLAYNTYLAATLSPLRQDSSDSTGSTAKLKAEHVLGADHYNESPRALDDEPPPAWLAKWGGSAADSTAHHQSGTTISPTVHPRQPPSHDSAAHYVHHHMSSSPAHHQFHRHQPVSASVLSPTTAFSPRYPPTQPYSPPPGAGDAASPTNTDSVRYPPATIASPAHPSSSTSTAGAASPPTSAATYHQHYPFPTTAYSPPQQQQQQPQQPQQQSTASSPQPPWQQQPAFHQHQQQYHGHHHHHHASAPVAVMDAAAAERAMSPAAPRILPAGAGGVLPVAREAGSSAGGMGMRGGW
ncbi:hypothetical protein DFJ73DRAFT_759259 [Zopfochytrium polystomum]|nr:hypothetical protein DFJ73DRAFT_759259 [Zopfochytrium polystomum]